MSAAPSPEPSPLPTGDATPGAVEGERGPTQVQRPRSLQARWQQRMALALVLSVGVGTLTLYYWHWSATLQARSSAHSRDTQLKAASEMRLPRLAKAPAAAPVSRAAALDPLDLFGSAPEIPLSSAEAGGNAALSGVPPVNRAPAPDPLLDAPVMLRDTRSSARLSEAPAARESETDTAVLSADAAADGSTPLARLVQPTAFGGVSAHTLPTQRLLLPKGASLDCSLLTAIDSTLPGLTTCVLAVDVFGADGRVVLLERGTQLVGETRSEVKQGQARVFVLWNEARTPTGVIIPLAAPGTDALGRAGLAGGLDTHFQERFGAAILVSIIDGAIQAAVAGQRGDAGASVVVDPQGSREVLTEIMKKTIAIPPTIIVNQGARVAVLVARDVDFRSVYALRTQY